MLAIWFAGMVYASSSLSAAERGERANKEIVFDIPSQALVTALNAYGAVTQTSVFYDGALAIGRRSTAVEGVFTPQQALRRLLEGTDVMARSTEAGTITITPSDGALQEDLLEIKNRSIGFKSYLGLVQAGLSAAMCKDKRLEATPVDILVRFRIASNGQLVQAELLTTTGNPDRDVAYTELLQHVDLDTPPPVDMPQPITLLLLPHTSLAQPHCAASSQAATQ